MVKHRIWILYDNERTVPPTSVTLQDHDDNTIVEDLRHVVAARLTEEHAVANLGRLTFWELNEPLRTGGELPSGVRLEDIATRIDMSAPIGPFVASSSSPNKVYLVVRSTAPQHGLPLEEKEGKRDILARLNTSFKNTVHQELAREPPAKSAKSSEYRKIQKGPGRIFDGRHADNDMISTTAPPIELFNPAFAYFSSKAFDPHYDVPKDIICKTGDLMGRFAAIYPHEGFRKKEILSLLETAIDHPFLDVQNADETQPHGLGVTSYGDIPVYLILSEEKNEFGDGGSDPSVQASFSFLRLLSQDRNQKLLLRCCCPMFLVAHAGPWVSVLGGIITDRCIVQRLTDFIWLPVHATQDEDQYVRVARILYALRQSVALLKVWYGDTLKTTAPYDLDYAAPHPRFFPTPNTFIQGKELVKFAYQQPLGTSASCVTYLAKTISDQRIDIVVKFVRRYGEDVHREMAKMGFAPKLLYCGSIDVAETLWYGSLRMVVMEFVDGTTADTALHEGQLPEVFLPQLHYAVEHLHSKQFVFGDLPQPNAMLMKDGKVQLVNFDWAGKEGEVEYPVSISSRIDWPRGVKALEPIQKQHDLDMLSPSLWTC